MKKSKRKLLRDVSYLGIGLATIPDKWVSPVVQSVVLPTHAATSGCATSITTLTVSDPTCDFDDNVYYRVVIDDSLPSGPFPFCIEGPIADPGDPDGSGSFIRIRLNRNSNDSVGVGILVSGNPGGQGLNNDCDTPSATINNNLNVGVPGVPNGSARTLSFDLIRDDSGGPSITINDFATS